jgi:L-ribulokinase
VEVRRVINGGGIPQQNPVLNQVYANVLGKPVLVPAGKVVSLGSAIFAFLAAGTFKTIEEAQDRVCPQYKVYKPEVEAHGVYESLYPLYRKLYCALGGECDASLGDVLPTLIKTAEAVSKKAVVTAKA